MPRYTPIQSILPFLSLIAPSSYHYDTKSARSFIDSPHLPDNVVLHSLVPYSSSLTALASSLSVSLVSFLLSHLPSPVLLSLLSRTNPPLYTKSLFRSSLQSLIVHQHFSIHHLSSSNSICLHLSIHLIRLLLILPFIYSFKRFHHNSASYYRS